MLVVIRIHGRILINACVKYQKQIFIGVRDIHADGQNFSNILSIGANKNGEKSTILNLILNFFYSIHGANVVNACVKYRKQICIGVGYIHPDGQNFQIFRQFEQTKMAIS